MNLAGTLIMIVLTQGSLSGETHTVSFTGKEVPMKSILRIIRCQTGVGFFYDASLFKDAKPVSVEWENASLDKALNDIFKDLPVSWILEDKTVTIFKKPTQILPQPKLRYYR